MEGMTWNLACLSILATSRNYSIPASIGPISASGGQKKLAQWNWGLKENARKVWNVACWCWWGLCHHGCPVVARFHRRRGWMALQLNGKPLKLFHSNKIFGGHVGDRGSRSSCHRSAKNLILSSLKVEKHSSNHGQTRYPYPPSQASHLGEFGRNHDRFFTNVLLFFIHFIFIFGKTYYWS